LFQIDPSWFQIDTWFIALVIISIIGFIAAAVYWGVRAHKRQVSAGKEELIGRTAEVTAALKPKGVVFVDGERWTAISEQGRVQTGEEVIITKVDGLKLWVTKKQ
jgi:membrane-bound ClpP family serine protease